MTVGSEAGFGKYVRSASKTIRDPYHDDKLPILHINMHLKFLLSPISTYRYLINFCRFGREYNFFVRSGFRRLKVQKPKFSEPDHVPKIITYGTWWGSQNRNSDPDQRSHPDHGRDILLPAWRADKPCRGCWVTWGSRRNPDPDQWSHYVKDPDHGYNIPAWRADKPCRGCWGSGRNPDPDQWSQNVTDPDHGYSIPAWRADKPCRAVEDLAKIRIRIRGAKTLQIRITAII